MGMSFLWETSHGMGWDRHKLLWDGNGTDNYVQWTTFQICTIYVRVTALQAAQNALAGRIWPVGRSLPTSDLEPVMKPYYKGGGYARFHVALV